MLNPNGTVNNNSSFIGNINPFRYRGYYYDQETGLYYLQSRYYDPATGRFINADDGSILGIGMNVIGGTNLFSYCLNNPVMDVDPTGEVIPSMLIGALVGAVLGGAFAYFNGDDVVKGIAVGALCGFIAGSGVGLLGGAIAGATGGFGGGLLGELWDNGGNINQVNWTNVGISTLIGGVCGAVTGGTTKLIDKGFKNLINSNTTVASDLASMSLINGFNSNYNRIIASTISLGNKNILANTLTSAAYSSSFLGVEYHVKKYY